MVNSEQKRKLIADYGDSLDAPVAVARSVAGLLIVVLIALVGATSPDQTSDSSAKAEAPQAGGKAAAELSAKRVATGR